MRVKLSGFRELEEALVELETLTGKTTAGKNVLRRTATKAMKRIEDRAKGLAPRDEGDLAGSITTKPVSTAQRVSRTRFERSSGVTVLTGPTGRQEGGNPAWQEYGTVRMQPNPYMRPSADAEADNVIADVREILTVEIGKAKARIARKAAR